MPHAPCEHTCPDGHVFPHAPQLPLSVAVLAQYGLPSRTHRVCSAVQLELHLPALQMKPAGHTLPQPPQLPLSVAMTAQ